MTNREKLEAMTDEQLAEFLLTADNDYCVPVDCTERTYERIKCIQKWLKTEEEKNETD